MEELFDSVFENLEFNLQREFSRYIVKVPQVKGLFYVLIRKPRGTILGESLKNMTDDVKYISEKVYKDFSNQSNRFRYRFVHYLNWLGAMVLLVSLFSCKRRLSK